MVISQLCDKLELFCVVRFGKRDLRGGSFFVPELWCFGGHFSGKEKSQTQMCQIMNPPNQSTSEDGIQYDVKLNIRFRPSKFPWKFKRGVSGYL